MLQRTHPHEQTIGDTLLVPDNLAEYADPILYNPENGPVEPDGPFLLSLVKRLGGAVLELGCGTGRITIPMAENGVGITGLDAVPAMVRRAKQKAQSLPVRWVVADARDYRLGQAFKLIFESGSVFQHMLDRCDQEAFLARVREHLAEGGLFVDGLMFPHTDLLSSVEVEQEWYSYEGPEGQEVRVSGVEDYAEALRLERVRDAFFGSGSLSGAAVPAHCPGDGPAQGRRATLA